MAENVQSYVAFISVILSVYISINSDLSAVCFLFTMSSIFSWNVSLILISTLSSMYSFNCSFNCDISSSAKRDARISSNSGIRALETVYEKHVVKRTTIINNSIPNENRQQFTWRRNDKTQASRIDMILLGKDFLSLVQGYKIKPAVIQYTDHQSVVLTFRSGCLKREEGIGKLIIL